MKSPKTIVKLTLMLSVALTVVAPPEESLAAYGARSAAIMLSLSDKKFSEEETKALRSALESYFKKREACFNALVDILAKSSDAPQLSAWASRVDTFRSDTSSTLGGALSSVRDPSKGAVEFLNAFHKEEDDFIAALGSAVMVPSGRDEIAGISDRLSEMTGTLTTKWTELKGRDESLDARTRRLTQELRRSFDTAIKDLTAAQGSLKEQARRLAAKAADSKPYKPGTGLDPMIEIAKLMAKSMAAAAAAAEKADEDFQRRVSDNNSIIRSEQGVLLIFEDVREDTEDFIETNNLARAKEAYGRAASALDRLANRSPVGQSVDAKDLGAASRGKLDAHLKKVEETHNGFVRKFEHIFFGPIGPNIKEELLEKEIWKDEISALVGNDLDRLLQTWRRLGREQVRLVLDIVENDRGELAGEVARRLKGAWESDLARVEKEMSDAMQNLSDSAVPQKLNRDDLNRELD